MKKYRIKVVRYGDGRTQYIPQVRKYGIYRKLINVINISVIFYDLKSAEKYIEICKKEDISKTYTVDYVRVK